MKKSRTIRWVLLISAVVRLGYFGWHRFHGGDQRDGRAKCRKSRRAAAVRVTIAPVEKTDFPVYLTGLGTVQGFNTVVVRTRVDGQIDKIAFKEGQLVNQGDLLVEIDPRPYQAALDQAKAKKAQDEANLANANLDLQRYTKLGEFATRQQTDTQRSTVAQLTAQIAADDAAIFNAQTQLDYTAGQVADLGRRRPASGRYRQHRQRLDPDRHRDDRPDRADRRHFHRAGRATALYKRGAIDPAAQGDRDHDRRQETTGRGNVGGGQQSGRHHQRDHSPQGGVRQQGPCIVAGSVGLYAASGEDAEGCDGGSRRRDPAWYRRALRLCRQSGQQGRAAQGQGQPIDRRTLRGR